jgi:DNA-binding SARP family transcriptional activator
MTSPFIALTLFGGFDVRIDNAPVDGFISNKARALLAFLFVTNRTHPRPVLAELFWGDKPDDVANVSLRMALSNLRKLLGAALDITRTDVSVAKGCRYALDVELFQTRLSQVDPATLESNCNSLEQAIALYGGDFLEGLSVRDASSFEEWALRQRERYRQMALQALYRLSMIHTDRGSYTLAIQYTTRLLELEPWQEEGHRQMMLLLAMTGQRSAALAQYAACRRILAEELNVGPMPETNALLARIRAMPEAPAAPAQAAMGSETLFGRQREHGWMLQQWRTAQERRSQITLIEGEVGIGKTRLVEEAMRQAIAAGATVLRARCHEFGHDLPFHPFVEILRQLLARQPDLPSHISPVWLAELAGLLPELADRNPEFLDLALRAPNPSARPRLFESVSQFLRIAQQTQAPQPSAAGAARPPGNGQPKSPGPLPKPSEKPAPCWKVLFIDDLHWIDAASVDLLRYLAHRLDGCTVWFIGAYQREGMAADHPLLRLRRSLVAEGRADLLRLERLPASAMAEWVRALPGLNGEQVARLAEYVVNRSEGNPFVSSHLLKELRESATLREIHGVWRLEDGWTPLARTIPFAVREVILLKLERLSPAGRALLGEASGLGESFTHDVLRQVFGRDEDLTDALAECLHQGLFSPSQPGYYRFSHTMIREIAYERLSPWHRIKVHARRSQGEIPDPVRRAPSMKATGAYA